MEIFVGDVEIFVVYVEKVVGDVEIFVVDVEIFVSMTPFDNNQPCNFCHSFSSSSLFVLICDYCQSPLSSMWGSLILL